MGPLTGAVDLIDAHHAYPSLVLTKVFQEELLRRDEQNFHQLVLHSFKNLSLEFKVLLRINRSSWDEVGKLAKLVSHEGNQGSHHQNKAWQEERHELVDQRLTPTCC